MSQNTNTELYNLVVSILIAALGLLGGAIMFIVKGFKKNDDNHYESSRKHGEAIARLETSIEDLKKEHEKNHRGRK